MSVREQRGAMDAAPSVRPGWAALLGAGLGGVALVLLPVVATHAGFLTTATTTATLTAQVDVAQGANCDAQYADLDHPNLLTPSGTVAYLPRASAAAFVPTARLDIPFCTLHSASGADVRVRVPRGGDDLMFAISVDGASVAGPIDAARLATEGVALPVSAAAQTLSISVWIAPTAPPAAFGASRQLSITVSAETVGGHTHELEVTS